MEAGMNTKDMQTRSGKTEHAGVSEERKTADTGRSGERKMADAGMPEEGKTPFAGVPGKRKTEYAGFMQDGAARAAAALLFCWICWRFIYPVFWRWRSGLR